MKLLQYLLLLTFINLTMFVNNGECKGRGWGSRGTGGGWGYQGIPISLGGWGNSWSSGGNIGGHWKADLKEGDGIWLPADKYYIPKHTRMYEDDQEASYIMAKLKEMVGGTTVGTWEKVMAVVVEGNPSGTSKNSKSGGETWRSNSRGSGSGGGSWRSVSRSSGSSGGVWKTDLSKGVYGGGFRLPNPVKGTSTSNHIGGLEFQEGGEGLVVPKSKKYSKDLPHLYLF